MDANIKLNEYLYRRVDIEDVVSAHQLALEKAPDICFRRYIISATTPFTHADLLDLRANAPLALKCWAPEYEVVYARLGWKMFPIIDRVYANEKARNELGWQPRYSFASLLERLKAGETDLRSPLARVVVAKGYHDQTFADGPYPV